MTVTFTPSLNDLGLIDGQRVVFVRSAVQRRRFMVVGASAPEPKYPNRHAARKAAKLARNRQS